MISHSKKFIFIHIPKTGGTSIESKLLKYGTLLQGKNNFGSMYYKHATAEGINRMMGDEFEKYFKFTFVRNPWDWVVSNYAFNRGLTQPFIVDNKYEICGKVPDWARDMSFPNWLRWWISDFKPSQIGMITGGDGEILVNSICRFEHLQKDFKGLLSKLNIRVPNMFLPHLKSSERGSNYMSYHNAETRSLMERHFALDIRLWNELNV